MGIYSIYSGDKLRIMRKPDGDNCVLTRNVKNGRLRYYKVSELREERAGELKQALEEAPPWGM